MLNWAYGGGGEESRMRLPDLELEQLDGYGAIYHEKNDGEE